MTHRPFVFIVIFYGAGILTGHYTYASHGYLFPATAFVILLSCVLFKRPKFSTYCIFLTLFFLGMGSISHARYLARDDITRVPYYKAQSLKLRGAIYSDIEIHRIGFMDKTSFTLEVLSVETFGKRQKKSGRVLVNIFRKEENLNYGDEIILEGKLHRAYNFASTGHFSYQDYLENHGVRRILSVKKNTPIDILGHERGHYFLSLLLKWRKFFKNILKDHLTKNEAAIMQGFLLGDRSYIPKHIKELFVHTGTAHILAISGMNVGFVAAMMFLFLKMTPLARKMQFILIIVFLVFYAVLTGAMPSVVRATIMAVILLLSYIMDEEADSINTLCCAAFLILIVNPLNLFDVGFQLSFACVMAIFIIYPFGMKLLEPFFSRYRSFGVRFIFQSSIISLAAWVGVAGLIVYYFEMVTPVTILANLFVVPLSSFIIYLGFGLLAVAGLFPYGAYIFAYLIKLTLNVMVGLVFLFDKLPFAYFYVRDVSMKSVMIYYLAVILIFCVVHFNNRDRHYF